MSTCHTKEPGSYLKRIGHTCSLNVYMHALCLAYQDGVLCEEPCFYLKC